MSIPFHDDHNKPPHERTKHVHFNSPIAALAFYNARDKAFSNLDSRVLCIFLDSYKIHHEPPYISGKANLGFWAMIYTAVLHSGLGDESSRERANIWLNRTRFDAGQLCDTNLKPVAWNLALGTYSVFGTTYGLPPLLKMKRPR